MNLFRRFATASDNLFRTKRSAVPHKNSWNIEYVFLTTKVQVPSPPKRPLTAYMIFCKENRKSLLKESPTLSSPEQIKVLAQKWRHLTEEMKKPYEISARESTLVYGELHKKFYESLSEEQKEELVRLKSMKRESRRISKLKRALKESGIPKLPCSAYGFFVNSQAKSRDNSKSAAEFIKEVSAEWKNLSEHERKLYDDQAQKDKERSTKEFTAWKEKLQRENKASLLKSYEELRHKGRSVHLDDAEPLLPKLKKSVESKMDDAKN